MKQAHTRSFIRFVNPPGNLFFVTMAHLLKSVKPVLWAAILTCGTTHVQASIITFSYTAVFDRGFQLDLAPFNPVGGAIDQLHDLPFITGTFSFDTGAMITRSGDIGGGVFNQYATGNITIDQLNPGVSILDAFTRVDDATSVDGVQDGVRIRQDITAFSGASHEEIQLSIRASEFDIDVYDGTALPTEFDLSQFRTKEIRIIKGALGVSQFIDFNITSVNQIPSPSTLLLLICGGALLICRRRSVIKRLKTVD